MYKLGASYDHTPTCTCPYRYYKEEVRTLFSAIAGLSWPRQSLMEASQKETRPVIGRYSWLRVSSLAMCCSAVLTTGRTHGLPSSVRYAVY